MFSQCDAFNGDISIWDVSRVTHMGRMFEYSGNFNGDISAWDVSHVTDMASMFSFAGSFNGDISAWDVSSVTTLEYMFFCKSILLEFGVARFYWNLGWQWWFKSWWRRGVKKMREGGYGRCQGDERGVGVVVMTSTLPAYQQPSRQIFFSLVGHRRRNL
jgi:surface protein